ncbi:hypothetical protein ACIQC5_01840 [Paenarthrobacter sp. NPDC092416]|uniref:hypothetical protein n=1 Tax=Paenarthrobacter sp. NPDC092416 TaxID=3364386 RepID=UPI00381D71D6
MLLNLPPLLVLGPFVGVIVVYLFLRLQVWSTPDAQSVASHGLWVGIIGWVASSLQGAMTAGILRGSPMGSSAPAAPDQIAGALAWPILATLAVHALGQLSYPAPKAPRRYAELAVRRVRDFLPRALTWTTVAIFTYAALVIAWTATLPAHTPVLPSPPSAPVSPNYTGYGGQGQDGRIPGPELAAWLGGALLVLALGTWLALLLIARRRHLETLDGDDNRALRIIATNRLLRTVATIAAGLASVAGNFAAQPAPGAMWQSSWVNYLGIVNMAVLIAMWWWRVPGLPSLVAARQTTSANTLRTDPGAHPAAKLAASIGPALGIIGGLTLLAGPGLALMPGDIPSSVRPPGILAVMASLILLAISCGELLIARNYGAADAPVRWPRQPVSRGLLTVAIVSALICALSVAFTAAGQELLPGPPAWPASLAMTAAVAIVGSSAILTVRFRRGVPEAEGDAGLDAALRAISMYRIVRTLAAYCLGQAAVLLLTNTEAWGALFPAFDRIAPSPATLIGAALTAAAVLIAVTPVRNLFRWIPRGHQARQGQQVP